MLFQRKHVEPVVSSQILLGPTTSPYLSAATRGHFAEQPASSLQSTRTLTLPPNTSKMAQYSKEVLEYMVHHVVLPPKLPAQAEEKAFVATAEKALLQMVCEVARRFSEQLRPESRSSWRIIQRMLTCCIETDLRSTDSLNTFHVPDIDRIQRR